MNLKKVVRTVPEVHKHRNIYLQFFNMNLNKVVANHKLPTGYYKISLGALDVTTGAVMLGDPFEPANCIKLGLPNYNRYAVEVLFKDCGEWGHRVSLAYLKMSLEGKTDWRRWESNDKLIIGSGMSGFSDAYTAANFTQQVVEYQSNYPYDNYYNRF